MPHLPRPHQPQLKARASSSEAYRPASASRRIAQTRIPRPLPAQPWPSPPNSPASPPTPHCPECPGAVTRRGETHPPGGSDSKPVNNRSEQHRPLTAADADDVRTITAVIDPISPRASGRGVRFPRRLTPVILTQADHRIAYVTDIRRALPRAGAAVALSRKPWGQRSFRMPGVRPTIQPSPPQPPATVTALHEPGRGQPAQTAHHRIEIHPRGDRDPGRDRPGPGRDGFEHPGAVRVEQVTREHRSPRPAGI